MKETETKTQNRKPSKGKKVVKVILNTIINILIVIVLITSVFIAVLSLTSKANNGVATIFGYSFHTIQTPSMDGGSPQYPGGDYKVGDLVIGKASGAQDRDYMLGDIVAYRAEAEDGSPMIICHRIVGVSEGNGVKSYQTQGDANDMPDQNAVDNYIHNYDITSLCYDAEYHGTVLSGWGKPLDFIRQPQGFFFVVLLPMIVFFMYEIIRVILNAMNYKKSKAEEEKENAEKEKDDAVKAAVAAALAEQNAGVLSEGTSGMSAEEMEQFRQFQAFQKMQNAQKNTENTENTSDTPDEE